MSSCDANTVLSTVIGFSLLIISEVLPMLDIKPNGILDAIVKVLRSRQQTTPTPNQVVHRDPEETV